MKRLEQTREEQRTLKIAIRGVTMKIIVDIVMGYTDDIDEQVALLRQIAYQLETEKVCPSGSWELDKEK